MVDLYPLITALTSSITPKHIVIVLTSIIGVGMTFVLMWFGIRKLVLIFRKSAIEGILWGNSLGSFNYSDGNKDREVYKQLLSWEHSSGVHHINDDDF